MKERPILFSAPMVRALLAGTKTQTRRVVKPQPHAGVRRSPFVKSGLEDGHGREIKNPYGQPGDRLWVRETFTRHEDESGFGSGRTLYRADMEGYEAPWAWTPSIFMPRWASRITLEVIGVRVERLQDISEEDARAEGIYEVWPGRWHWMDVAFCDFQTARDAYRALFESINGPGSWEPDPWVLVVEFKPIVAPAGEGE